MNEVNVTCEKEDNYTTYTYIEKTKKNFAKDLKIYLSFDKTNNSEAGVVIDHNDFGVFLSKEVAIDIAKKILNYYGVKYDN